MGTRPRGNRTAIILLALSICFALIATGIVFVVFRSYELRVANTDLARQRELVDVVVAKADLERGKTIQEDDLSIIRLPRAFFLDSMVSAPDAIQGRVPSERILAGEPLRHERLADPKAGLGLNALIPKGQRALQVELTGAAGVAGFINPGDYVDLIFTSASGEHDEYWGDSGPKTRTILQSKLVLAVDNLLGALDDGGQAGTAVPSVTLAVTPDEAQQVTLATLAGVVTLTLRNHVDVTKTETHGVTSGAFIGVEGRREPVKATGTARRRTPKPEVQDPNQVLVITGSDRRLLEEE